MCASIRSPDGPVDVIALKPHETDLPYSEATVWIASKDGLVRRTRIVRHRDNGGPSRCSISPVNKPIPAVSSDSPEGRLQVVDQ